MFVKNPMYKAVKNLYESGQISVSPYDILSLFGYKLSRFPATISGPERLEIDGHEIFVDEFGNLQTYLRKDHQGEPSYENMFVDKLMLRIVYDETDESYRVSLTTLGCTPIGQIEEHHIVLSTINLGPEDSLFSKPLDESFLFQTVMRRQLIERILSTVHESELPTECFNIICGFKVII